MVGSKEGFLIESFESDSSNDISPEIGLRTGVEPGQAVTFVGTVTLLRP